MGITPEGREVLPFGPKNHSKVGEGTSEGRGMGSLERAAEQFNEYVSPAVLEPEEDINMVTRSPEGSSLKLTMRIIALL